MTKDAYDILENSAFLGTAGILTAFFPRVIPRVINACLAFCGWKSRLDESDHEKLGVRVTGGVFVVFAIYVLIHGWSDLWK
jgi:hypothetical protein